MAVHEGHRARKKEQFRSHGLDAFADHEVLELLLYYAVPRQDTNPIAHRLMEKFGSLEAVFSAGCAELESVAALSSGEGSATPLGWLCATTTLLAPQRSAFSTILRILSCTLSMPPAAIRWHASRRPFASRQAA